MSTTEEITLLEYRLQAYIVRTSMLQSRLLSTLDTLDVLQRTHQEELSSITTERDGLKMELHRYVEFVESAKSERNDMRDAVMKLIEKVQVSNDYSKWPHSQIYLSSLAEPSTPNQSSENEENVQSYAASVIEILRKQRDSERLAHARTRDLADSQHVALKAMLSRRDAELENCIASLEQPTKGGDRLRDPEQIPPECEAISRDEMVSVLELTTARNKILETEVKILAKRLEEARSAQRRTSAYAGPSTNYTTHSFNPDDILRPAGSRRSLAKERPIKLLDSDQLIGLENQINELGLKIDAFAAERKAIVESVGLAALDVEPNLENPHHPSDELHLRLQLECDRFRRTETELRNQLNDTRMDAQERESELLAEISALRQTVQPLSNYVEVAIETEPPYLPSPPPPTNLLEPNEDEQSMELATPLMPTSALSTHLTEPLTDDVHMHLHHVPHAHSWLRAQTPTGNSTSVGHEIFRHDDYPVNPASEIESPYVDPPTIPLPHSPEPEPEPEGLSAWEENSPSDLNLSELDFPIPPGFSSS